MSALVLVGVDENRKNVYIFKIFLLNLQEPCVLHIGRAYRYPPHVALYIFSTNVSTECFKHAVHSPFFSSKCRLIHNAIFFGSCIIQILHTGVLKFKCKTPVPKC
jgi:hypothetical protein